MDPLTAAIRANPFMTGYIPPEIYSPPMIGELRSYLPPESRVTALAIFLYAAGVTPWSWAREPDFIVDADPDRAVAMHIEAGIAQLEAHMRASLGLMDAVMEAELLARESGKRLYDPTTMTPLFPDEQDTLQ
jgi:hypothetical protein